MSPSGNHTLCKTTNLTTKLSYYTVTPVKNTFFQDHLRLLTRWYEEIGWSWSIFNNSACKCGWSESVSSSLSRLYAMSFRTQQSSREAAGTECISIWGRGHLEATRLEQQPQTHPRLWGQPKTCPHNSYSGANIVHMEWTVPTAGEQCNDLFVLLSI